MIGVSLSRVMVSYGAPSSAVCRYLGPLLPRSEVIAEPFPLDVWTQSSSPAVRSASRSAATSGPRTMLHSMERARERCTLVMAGARPDEHPILHFME